jgi:Family of unknown function (DUF6228)
MVGQVLRLDLAGRDVMTDPVDSDVFQVRSNSGGAIFELTGANVRLARRGLEARTAVYELEEGEIGRGLATFFGSLARDWRGWEGERVWSSLEGEFGLRALHDGLGTVELIATLGQPEPTVEGTWSATVSLFLDAGGLDSLARRAASVLS